MRPAGELPPSSPPPGIPTAAAPSLAPEDLLAGRFRIVRFIAHGGMGEVYEAEDLTLHERVALKTVRREVARDPHALERFVHEVQLARKVTDPNVCRIFEVFQHRAAADGPGRDVTFVTMELLPGETLADRLARSGQMTTAEALPIVQQMISGLAAAHKAGVVHRDFKTGNVSLVPAPEGEGGLRAVVADFGLARGRAAEAADASLTEVGLIVGTPAYMAPEQMEGHDVTAASDIYSLGVAIYEMVTGKLPFPGETVAAAARRLREKPSSPRAHVPDLDLRWEEVILRCLERDPIDRFASVTDVARALAGEDVTPGRRTLIEKHERELQWRRMGRTALAATAVLLLGLGAYSVLFRRPPPRPTTLQPRRSVAVLGFKNLSGREGAAWLSTALSEMLTMELAAGETLRVVPGESVARMKIDLALPDTDTLAKDTLARIRKSLSSDLVVLGSYFASGPEGGGRVRIDLRLQETAGGEMVAAVTDSGTEAKLLDLVSRTGARLRETLGLGTLSTVEAAGVKAAAPANPEAARLYAAGLARLRVFDALAARELLERGVAAAPTAPLVHSALAEAWAALGFDAKAEAAARQAFVLSDDLPREERLVVEGRYQEAARQWQKAVETYHTLWGFFPDNLEYGLRLAHAQTAAGRGKDALGTLEALRRLPPPHSQDPRIDLAEVRAAEALSEYRRCLASAARAAEKGAAAGARLLVAEARLQESRALWRLSELAQASSAAEEARRMFAEVGDRVGVARAANVMANVLREQSDLDPARRVFEDVLAMGRESGNKDVMQRALHNIAGVLRQQGDLSAASRMYAESIAGCREIGDRRGAARTMSNLAGVLRQRGKLDEARRVCEEALAISREVQEQLGVARALNTLGTILADQGELAGSQERCQASLALYEKLGDPGGVAYPLDCLGDVDFHRGNPDGARRSYARATAARARLGDVDWIARLGLARVALEEGRAAEAESFAREAAQTLERNKRPDEAASAWGLVVDTVLAQDRPGDATAALERAQALAGRSQDVTVRLSAAVTAARVLAATGRAAEAVRRLEVSLEEAQKRGLVGLALEARLALGEIETRFGEVANGRRSLAALEGEAKERGFGLIARKARKALS